MENQSWKPACRLHGKKDWAEEELGAWSGSPGTCTRQRWATRLSTKSRFRGFPRVDLPCGTKLNVNAYKMCTAHSKCLTVISIIMLLGSWWKLQGSGQSFTETEGNRTPDPLQTLLPPLPLPGPFLLLLFYCIYSRPYVRPLVTSQTVLHQRKHVGQLAKSPSPS